MHAGVKAVDDVLDGGVESKSITEIYGEYRCDLHACDQNTTAASYFRPPAFP
jgi:hypothetical protein